ncbi:MAG: hypothetical protein RIK87_18935 [Fuerstiella sp.]
MRKPQGCCENRTKSSNFESYFLFRALAGVVEFSQCFACFRKLSIRKRVKVQTTLQLVKPDIEARANCRAMFCHTEWYADLIRKHRGPANQSPIILWPYPIDPWPGEPLPDEYDLLIYARNGHRPPLLEHLAEVFPRHIQIHYGQYQREELFEAARRSRACAYLADDEYGPLALQEILLAGCPTVGVRTGSLVRTDW